MNPYTQSFNLGCQARLNGKPLSDNPFHTDDGARYRGWRAGHEHTSTCWGVDACWPIRPLPEILR